jgi:hypothetical protein
MVQRLEEVQTVQEVQNVQTVEEHKPRYDLEDIVEWWSRTAIYLKLSSSICQDSSTPTIHSSQRL